MLDNYYHITFSNRLSYMNIYVGNKLNPNGNCDTGHRVDAL